MHCKVFITLITDRNKFHPGDGNLYLLQLEKEPLWIRLSKLEELERTEHMMHIIENKVYIIGGYSYRNHVASEVFKYNQILEIEIVFPCEDNINFNFSHRLIEVDLPPGVDCNYITNFSYTGNSSYLYFFGGYTWMDYQPERPNLYALCPPHVSQHKKPIKSEYFFRMDLIKEELLYIKGPESYKTADGTLQILGKDVQNNPSEILIVGGISGRVDLYSTTSFDLDKCSLDDEFGGCNLEMTTRNRDSLTCIVPKCEKIVHRLCDKYTRGITTMDADKYFCPQCADFDPETRKKRPKVPKGKSKK